MNETSMFGRTLYVHQVDGKLVRCDVCGMPLPYAVWRDGKRECKHHQLTRLARIVRKAKTFLTIQQLNDVECKR